MTFVCSFGDKRSVHAGGRGLSQSWTQLDSEGFNALPELWYSASSSM